MQSLRSQIPFLLVVALIAAALVLDRDPMITSGLVALGAGLLGQGRQRRRDKDELDQDDSEE